MTSKRRSTPMGWTRPLAALALAILLAGCISLLPKTKPAQLYRFGETPAARGTASAAAPTSIAIRAEPLGFDRASAGDRILTVTGDRTAYIMGARWVTPATSLFDAALVRAFDESGGRATLLARGEPARADFTLKLDVRAFEARYDRGEQAPPTIVVEIFAAIDSPSDPSKSRHRVFRAALPAGDNRVGLIVAAFDQATSKVLGELVAWVNTSP